MSPNVEVKHWDENGWAVVLVKIARCDGCPTCGTARDPPTDFLAMPDAAPCCARCLHGDCHGAGGRWP